jgi:hypothetical protein
LLAKAVAVTRELRGMIGGTITFDTEEVSAGVSGMLYGEVNAVARDAHIGVGFDALLFERFPHPFLKP